jgi:hypothetical protein
MPKFGQIKEIVIRPANRKSKVPVSERAVLQRVNRKLKPDLEQVRKWRGGQYVGGYYYLNLERNWCKIENLDLEGFARELGVLADWEAMTREE